MMLDGFATTSWQGVRDSIMLWIWKSPIDSLHTGFGPMKLACKVCRDLFSKEQNAHTPANIFIYQAIATNSNVLVTQSQIDPSDIVILVF